MRIHAIRTAVLTATLLALGAACSDSSDRAIPAAMKSYCRQAVALNKQEAPATREQIDRLIAVAPEEIKADILLFSQAVATRPSAHEDPDVHAADQRIVAFDQRQCGIKPLP